MEVALGSWTIWLRSFGISKTMPIRGWWIAGKQAHIFHAACTDGPHNAWQSDDKCLLLSAVFTAGHFEVYSAGNMHVLLEVNHCCQLQVQSSHCWVLPHLVKTQFCHIVTFWHGFASILIQFMSWSKKYIPIQLCWDCADWPLYWIQCVFYLIFHFSEGKRPEWPQFLLNTFGTKKFICKSAIYSP